MITKKQTGFTIVELLIVIVIIGILAAITVVAYSNIQQRANNSKIASDLAQIQKAIITARSNKESPLFAIYPNGAPEGSCIAKASGTDLAALPKTDTCWTGYLNFLTAVSDASYVNLYIIGDPWGRPYYGTAHEGENSKAVGCQKDLIGTYSQPFVKSTTNVINIPIYKTSCP